MDIRFKANASTKGVSKWPQVPVRDPEARKRKTKEKIEMLKAMKEKGYTLVTDYLRSLEE